MMKPATPILIISLILLSFACSPSPEAIATTDTPILIETQAPNLPTATPITIVPKSGHWAGSTFEFDVITDGYIKDLKTGDNSNFFICNIKVDEIIIEQDGSFIFSQFDPLDNLAEKEKEVIKANANPNVIKTDKGEEFEILRITGKFDSPTSISGDIYLLSCLHNIYATGMKTTWEAEWKNP